MASKKYSSYAEIERDLKILKIEREINYQKICLSIHNTSESIIPIKVLSFFRSFYNVLSGKTETILKILIPIVVSWIIKKKRGD